MIESERASTPTISDVAAAAGVSRSTVARALGDYGYVSAEVRERVFEAAVSIGYRTNALARSMSTGVTHTLGVVVADIGNPFFSGIVRGISDASRARGFDTIVMSSHEDLDEEVASVTVLVDKQVDGIILASAAVQRNDLEHVRDATQRGTPVVLIDRAIEHIDLPAVVIDNRHAARSAVASLIALGHSRIGFVWGPSVAERPATRRAMIAASRSSVWSDSERLHGYLDALDDAGLPFDPALVTTGEKEEANATAEVRRLLALPDPPTALLVTENDGMTGALRAIAAQGLTWPRDLSLIGFDDSSWAAVTNPPLTMIRQPMLELGALAATTLLDEIAGEPAQHRLLELPTQLVERSSVGPPPQR